MRLIVGMTGATGAVLGVRVLQALRALNVETHLVMSRWARVTLAQEGPISAREVEASASVVYKSHDQGAAIASGSYPVDGMVVVPCSMKTLAGIRIGYSDGLTGRAADVMLKERRKLVLVARETPLSALHLENMLALTRMGAVVLPPVLAFYQRPATLDDVVDHLAGRVLDQFGLAMPGAPRWRGMRVVAGSTFREE
jgi:flavin prenyltransferase